MHPLYQQARENKEETKMDTKLAPETTESVVDVKKKKELELEESVILTPEEITELRRILEDNYSKGAFTGMITNLFFSGVNTNNVQGVDTIIKQALMIRLKAYDMAGKKIPVTIPLPLEVKPAFKGVNMVM